MELSKQLGCTNARPWIATKGRVVRGDAVCPRTTERVRLPFTAIKWPVLTVDISRIHHDPCAGTYSLHSLTSRHDPAARRGTVWRTGQKRNPDRNMPLQASSVATQRLKLFAQQVIAGASPASPSQSATYRCCCAYYPTRQAFVTSSESFLVTPKETGLRVRVEQSSRRSLIFRQN